MGVAFFPTFIDGFLFAIKNPGKSVDLTNQIVIIDGYSFFYFIYDQTRSEDQSKSMAERVTATQFGYDGLWKKLRDSLRQFKEKCAEVVVVFDGVSRPNKYRREDPERASSVKFNDDGCRVPFLVHDELMVILHDLQIEVYVSPGEADPMVVQMARKRNAYIVARDSDYYLYEIQRGYVPLPQLTLSTLEGQSYHMTDVFYGMTQRSVALWVTTIDFEFITLEVLQDEFSPISARDRKEFNRWLTDIESDAEKHQRLVCQYSVLRYIQQEGEDKAYEKLLMLASKHQSEFEQAMQSYIDISFERPKLTQNGNEIPEFLNELYSIGKLDRAVINILVTGNVLHYQQESNLVHLNLLLPMCHILIHWDYSKSTIRCSTVIFHEQAYNPLELVSSDDLPLLDELIHLDESIRRRFVLSCVDFALKPLESLKWQGVHEDYKFLISLLKLWIHKREINPVVLEAVRLGMIISFFKHVLLDTYDETEERLLRSEKKPEKSWLQYSQQRLKEYFSREECFQLRKAIKNYASTLLTDKYIERELNECQQFYKELSMINQFCDQPYGMPPPRLYFSQLTYGLAIVLSRSKSIWKDIRTLCLQNELFFEFVQELHLFSM